MARFRSAYLFGLVLGGLVVLNVSFFGTLQLLSYFEPVIIDTGANADDLGWPGATLRVIIPASQVAVGGSGIRVTFGAGPSRGLHIADAFIGELAHSDIPYNFASSPHRLTFSGRRDVTIERRGAVTTDEVKMPVQAGKSLMVSMLLNDKDNDDPVAKRPEAGWHTYFKFGDEAALINGSAGYNDRSPVFVSHGILGLTISP